MSFSSSRGFRPNVVLAWLRSEAAENYRPARSAVLQFDPWWQRDFDYLTAWVYAPVAISE